MGPNGERAGKVGAVQERSREQAAGAGRGTRRPGVGSPQKGVGLAESEDSVGVSPLIRAGVTPRIPGLSPAGHERCNPTRSPILQTNAAFPSGACCRLLVRQPYETDYTPLGVVRSRVRARARSGRSAGIRARSRCRDSRAVQTRAPAGASGRAGSRPRRGNRDLPGASPRDCELFVARRHPRGSQQPSASQSLQCCTGVGASHPRSLREQPIRSGASHSGPVRRPLGLRRADLRSAALSRVPRRKPGTRRYLTHRRTLSSRPGRRLPSRRPAGRVLGGVPTGGVTSSR